MEAPLMFMRDVSGQGSVSLVEEAPLSVMGEVGAKRHHSKRFILKIDGFRIHPGTASMSDDPFYLYVVRERISRTQASSDWWLWEGKLVNVNPILRSLHDTSDSELVLFDQGLGGSLRGGRAEIDSFLGAARLTPITDLLRSADKISKGKKVLGGMVRHAPALLK